jgi:RNA-splicing ligase RtcB
MLLPSVTIPSRIALSMIVTPSPLILQARGRTIECRKDADVVDETPMACKSIDPVMNAQRDLVEVVHTLRQIVCIKG